MKTDRVLIIRCERSSQTMQCYSNWVLTPFAYWLHWFERQSTMSLQSNQVYSFVQQIQKTVSGTARYTIKNLNSGVSVMKHDWFQVVFSLFNGCVFLTI